MNREDDFARFSRTDDLRADLKSKSIRGAAFVAYGGAADFALRFASIAILSRLLSPEDFGVIAMVVALTSILDGVRDLGLSAATVQRPEITHQQVSNLFWVNSLVGILFALAFCAISPLIAKFYGDARLVEVTIGLSFVFVWGAFAVQHEALMSRQLRQGELALVRFLASFLSTVLAIVLAVQGWGYWSLVWREVTRSALVALGVWYRCDWRPGTPRRGAGTRSLIRFGCELSATNVFTGLIANIDKLLIGRLYGAAPVGMFRQAQNLLVVPLDQLNGPIISVAQSALSALHDDPGRYRRYYERIAFMVALATLPLGLFVAIYAREVTLLVLGAKWVDATAYVRIFGIAAMIRPVVGTSAVVLISRGLSTRFFLLAIAHGAVLTIFVFIGVGWGPEGVALAHVATSVVLMFPKLYYSFLGTPVTVVGLLRAIRAPVTAMAVMLIGLLGLRYALPSASSFVSLMLGAFAGVTLYVLALAVQPRSRSELVVLLADVRRALQRRRSGTPIDDPS